MLKALGLGKRGGDTPAKPLNNSTVSLAIMDDALRVEEAFIAMDMVMDDRSKEALKLIQKNEGDGSGDKSVAREQSAFYKLVIGVIYFIEATLGFEPESIRRASEALAEAEAAAVRQKRNVSNHGANVSYSKYPPGTEYRVAFAEAELMGAITLFLSESYLESVKALYKLRKAYQTLDEISKSIRESKKPAKGAEHKSTLDSLSLAVSDDQEMASLVEKFQKTRLNRLNESNSSTPVASSAASMNTTTSSATALHQGSETIEEFIESGVDLCFGILQLVISIIPPTLGKILSVVGFRGSRDGGLSLLWEATNYRNIHGALALLVLLQFYDGPTQFSDLILPGTEEDLIQQGKYDINTADDTEIALTATITGGSGHSKKVHTLPKNPRRRMHKLLLAARGYYPHSALWMLQQGRMEASQCHLEKAVDIMDADIGPIEMKQVEALMLFDKTMFMLFLNRYEQSAINFIRLIDINAWSHAWYTYVAATCSIEIYRENLRAGNAEAAKEAKDTATRLLNEAPGLIGKKKLMAKTMPMDVFLSRKISQMQQLSKQHNIDLVDAAGVSPVQEVVYFWNGYGKMPEYALEKVFSEVLAYSAAPIAPSHIPEQENEKTVRHLLQAVALRNMGKVEEGYKMLNDNVISQIITESNGKYQYNKSVTHKDPWMPPSALYERAMFEWVMQGPKGTETVREWLHLAERWSDDYELSTRVGMKIKSAFERLDGGALA